MIMHLYEDRQKIRRVNLDSRNMRLLAVYYHNGDSWQDANNQYRVYQHRTEYYVYKFGGITRYYEVGGYGVTGDMQRRVDNIAEIDREQLIQCIEGCIIGVWQGTRDGFGREVPDIKYIPDGDQFDEEDVFASSGKQGIDIWLERYGDRL